MVHGKRVIAITFTPAVDDSCSSGGRSALLELDAATGGELSDPVFDVNGDGVIDVTDVSVAGFESDSILSAPRILQSTGNDGKVEERKVLGSGSASDPIVVVKERADATPSSQIRPGRRSWRELRNGG